MKNLILFVVSVILVGCYAPPLNIKGIKDATAACERFGGVGRMSGIDRYESGQVKCVSGALFYIDKNGVIK